MSVRSLTIACCLLMTSFLEAQVLIGPIAGPQASWVAFRNSDATQSLKQDLVWGYHAGIDVSFRVRDRFFLHLPFLYSLKGKALEGREDPLLSDRIRYHFIDLPITYAAEFDARAGRKQYKWFIGVGPHISYLLRGTGTVETPALHEFLIFETDYRLTFNDTPAQSATNELNVPEANRLQLGLNIAAGFVFEPVRYNKVMVMLRYEFGHSRLSRGEGTGSFEQVSDYESNFKIRNQGFRLSLAYLFDLKLDQRKRGKSTIDRKRL